MDNYIMLNGKKIELTNEQINLIFSSENDKISNCFDKFISRNEYYYIDYDGRVRENSGFFDEVTTNLYNVANYCADKKIIEQRALHEILNRILWRFSMINDGNKIDWSNFKDKFFIYYSYSDNKIEINYNTCCKYCITYFYSKEVAQRAIDEIIIPFINEHPEFVW